MYKKLINKEWKEAITLYYQRKYGYIYESKRRRNEKENIFLSAR